MVRAWGCELAAQCYGPKLMPLGQGMKGELKFTLLRCASSDNEVCPGIGRTGLLCRGSPVGLNPYPCQNPEPQGFKPLRLKRV